MKKIVLREIGAFDNGVNTPESFFIWKHPNQVPEMCKLVFDLLLRFRKVESKDAAVNFSEIGPFVDVAVGLVSTEARKAIAEISGRISVRDAGVGKLEWGAAGRGGDERAPTEEEMTWYEGEASLLFGGMEAAESRDARRISAAYGLYACDRALNCLRMDGPIESVAALLATAARCLGYSRVHSGWEMRERKAKDERRRGGMRQRAKNPEMEIALKYAEEFPSLSAVQIKTRAKLRASDRTIRKWISEAS